MTVKIDPRSEKFLEVKPLIEDSASRTEPNSLVSWPSMTATLPSEQVILESPLSYSGATRRIWRAVRPKPDTGKWARFGMFVLRWVCLLLMWDLITGIYISFGTVMLVPFLIWRVWRRSVRREKQNQLRHREMLDHAA